MPELTGPPGPRHPAPPQQLALLESGVLDFGLHDGEGVVDEIVDQAHSTDAAVLVGRADNALLEVGLEAEALGREEGVVGLEALGLGLGCSLDSAVRQRGIVPLVRSFFYSSKLGDFSLAMEGGNATFDF